MKKNLLSYNFFRTGFAWIILIVGIGGQGENPVYYA